MEDKFEVIVPAEISKSADGRYRIRGIATTQDFDSQNELVKQEGMDLTPIDAKRGVLNWDHGSDPTDIIGILDGYTHTKSGLMIEGTLFKKHTKANAIREIMESLGEKDKHRMGLSIQGSIIRRNDINPKIIEKCRINAVALTMNPVNTKTHVELMKSMNAPNLEFDTQNKEPTTTYSAEQVVSLLSKALGVGAGSAEAPNTRSGGDALAQENLDDKKKKKKKLLKAEEIEADLHGVLDKLQTLYPYNTRSDLWYAVKNRLTTKILTGADA